MSKWDKKEGVVILLSESKAIRVLQFRSTNRLKKYMLN